MKLEIVRRIVKILILIATVVFFDSVDAIVIGFAVASWIDALIITVPMHKLLGYNALSILKDIWKTIISLVIMALTVYLVGLINTFTWVLLVLQVMVGVIVYVLCGILFKNESLFALLKIIKKSK